jgi:two-component system, LytTR family, response regulator
MVPSRREEIRALVVDDEAPARERLVDLLRKDSEVRVVLEAAEGLVAVDMIRDERPDLIFLDVQMPELDGLGVIDAIGAALMPLTVFVTAYDQHALRAFEANALDYLLKPYSDERYDAAMARAKCRLDEQSIREFGQRMLQLASMTAAGPRHLDRVVVKSAGTIRFVRTVDIDWIEAAGVYVNLHVGVKELLCRTTLHELIERLDPLRFVRVHRSAVVNIESVLRLEAISHGEFEVILKNGCRTRISRTYRTQLERHLGQSL